MNSRRDFFKKATSSIPSVFNLSKYDFEDDFGLWMAALAPRVELRKEVDELLAWSISEGEFSEQRLALYRGFRKRLQDNVLSLMDRPIPLNGDSSDKPTPVNQMHAQSEVGRDQVSHLWGRAEAVSDRLVIDEVRSANKLQDQDYKKLFEHEIKKQAQKRDSQPSLNLFGIPVRREFGESRKIGETTTYMASNSMWRADIQMPNFSGEFGLKVNLFYDDKVLLEEFSKWLKATRAQANPLFSPHKVVTQDVLKEWKRMQILPCIDLRLYQDAFNVSFSWKEIGTSLYGDDFRTWGDVDKRAKDSDRRGKELLHPLSFHALRYKEMKPRNE